MRGVLGAGTPERGVECGNGGVWCRLGTDGEAGWVVSLPCEAVSDEPLFGHVTARYHVV